MREWKPTGKARVNSLKNTCKGDNLQVAWPLQEVWQALQRALLVAAGLARPGFALAAVRMQHTHWGHTQRMRWDHNHSMPHILLDSILQQAGISRFRPLSSGNLSEWHVTGVGAHSRCVSH